MSGCLKNCSNFLTILNYLGNFSRRFTKIHDQTYRTTGYRWIDKKKTNLPKWKIFIGFRSRLRQEWRIFSHQLSCTLFAGLLSITGQPSCKMHAVLLLEHFHKTLGKCIFTKGSWFTPRNRAFSSLNPFHFSRWYPHEEPDSLSAIAFLFSLSRDNKTLSSLLVLGYFPVKSRLASTTSTP